MRFPGTRGQLGTRDLSYRADGTVLSATLPQLILPEQWQRAHLKFQNTSTATMYLEFGSARAHATLTNGQVTSVTMDNQGFGFTLPPRVEFLGGGGDSNSTRIGTGDPYGPSPNIAPRNRHAKAHANVVGGAITSISIDDPGNGYLVAPYVRLTNSPLDFIGCADPSVGGGSGCILYPSQWFLDEDLTVPTEQVALFCGTLGATYFCRYL
jgi:hypothetical protein